MSRSVLAHSPRHVWSRLTFDVRLMNEEPTLADWKATAEAAMWFPYRRAVTRSFAKFIQSCVPEFSLQRCLYLGFESPSAIDTLQQSELASLHTSSSFDYWHTEADWWGDQLPSAYEVSRRAFMTEKVSRVIEGDPDAIDFLYFDRDLDDDRLDNLQSMLSTKTSRRHIDPKLIVLADIQESDGPTRISSVAMRQGWFRVRVGDSYIPHHEDHRPETFISYILVPTFAQGSAVVSLAHKQRLSVDTNQ